MYILPPFILCLLIASSSFLSAAMEPADKLSETVDDIIEFVYGDCCVSASPEQKQVKVQELLESRYDMTVLIRRALGRNWNLLDSKEQAQVLGLVKQLVTKAYVEGLNGKERPVVSFEKTIEISSKRIEVPSVVVLDGKSVHVLYRLGRIDSEWELFDIVAEGISVVSSFRQQFDDHFRTENGAQLITKLKELLKK